MPPRIRVVLVVLCSALLVAGCGSNASGSLSTPTAPATPVPNALTGCQDITRAGSYTLTADIGTPLAPGSTPDCLAISASNVTVDCAHHTINGNVSIGPGLGVVVVTNCTMTGLDNLVGETNVTISNSVFSGMVGAMFGGNIVLANNQITSTAGSPAAVVYLQNSADNRVTGNTLDGGYHGNDLTGHGNDAPGADDGVVLNNQSGDIIENNTIRNVFDAGIEGVNVVGGTTISNNTISHAISAGVSSYWCTNWVTNTISGNAVSDSEAAIWIIYLSGPLCGQLPGPAAQFTNNMITGNSLRGPLGTLLVGLEIGMDGTVNSNVVSGNDIGSTAMNLAPALGFSDGGGNTCGSAGSFKC